MIYVYVGASIFMGKITLICLPYAGGSSIIYIPFKRYINVNVKLLPIELRGRGTRISENLCQSFDEMIEDIINEILKNDIENYAVFGYSMGGTLAYEVAFELENKLGNSARAMFFAGSVPPHVLNDNKNTHLIDSDDEELVQYLEGFGGIPKDFKKFPKLLEIFLPIIRSDLKVFHNYIYKKHKKLNSDIHILYSDEDNGNNEIFKWKEYTSKICRFYRFEGGHFFINHYLKKIIDVINKVLI